MTAAAPAKADAQTEARAQGGFVRDFTASIVVFLVALPLCMGIAIASGVPAEKGLITGIIGGIVVGLLAGAPLQVSGPAAGLTVLVFEIVQERGLSALGPILVLAGLIQLAAGAVRLGQWFRAISPAVVHGMLAGIGALIVAAQIHVLMDRTPLHGGIANLVAIPGAFVDLQAMTLGQTQAALLVGVTTIVAMIGWEKLRPAALKLVPGALIGVLAATAMSLALSLGVKRIAVPENILATLSYPTMGDWAVLGQPAVVLTAFALAFIASAETLLCAAAVDRMHNGPRTKYNKELMAQGVGNALCGLAGALPMTGVIVRSSANVQAGAVSRRSAIMHGAWILGLVALLPWLLEMVPMAALAGVLVVTGWRLISLKHARHLFDNYGALPALVWAATFVMVVSTDLLTGVLTGIALSMLELIPHLKKPKLRIDVQPEDGATRVAMAGSATFIQLPKLSELLEGLPQEGRLKLHLKDLAHIDHTCAELFRDWLSRRRAAGAKVEIESGPAAARLASA